MKKIEIIIGDDLSLQIKSDLSEIMLIGVLEATKFAIFYNAELFPTFSIRLVRDFKAANPSHAKNLIKGSSNNLAHNPH